MSHSELRHPDGLGISPRRRLSITVCICAAWITSWGQAQPSRPAVQSGDSAWTLGRFAEAKAAYQRAIELEPGGASRAVYRLAVLASWDGDLAVAIAGFRRYLEMEPRDEEGRVALGRAFAWSGLTDSAVAVYDDVLSRDPTYRDAALGAAQALAWAGRFDRAIGRYDRWLAHNGKDAEATLGRARTLAWAGRLRASEEAYRRIIVDGEVLEGTKGVAIVSSWRGDLFESEEIWRRLTRDYPRDAEGWVGLAQVLRWSGRPDDAKNALDQALRLAPGNADARAQRRWVMADLAPAIAPLATYGWDSDGNRTGFGQLRASARPFRRVTASLAGSVRRAEFADLTGRSTTARLGLRWIPDRRLTVGAEGGVVETRAEQAATVVEQRQAVGALQATLKVTSRASIGGGVSRDLFDETAVLMRSGIEVTTASLDGEIELGRGLSLAAGGHRARMEGGSVPNERRAGYASARWRAHRVLLVGVAGRTIGYDASPRDGYFSPERFRHAELFGRLEPRRETGWTGHLEAGLGRQYVRFAGPGTTNTTQRIAVGLGFRPAPATEVGIDYAFSNVAASGAIGVALGSVYRYQAINVRARLRL